MIDKVRELLEAARDKLQLSIEEIETVLREGEEDLYSKCTSLEEELKKAISLIRIAKDTHEKHKGTV